MRRSRAVWAALALAASAGRASAADTATLLVYEDPACAPCVLFDRQVGAIYGRTDEARRVSLQRESFSAAMARTGPLAPPRVAPTFVLVQGGREIGRFEGYSSDELFWMNLHYLLQQLPATAHPGR